MRILYIINDLKVGGAENLVVSLANAIHTIKGVEAEILTLSDRASSSINKERIEQLNIKHTTLTSGSLLNPILLLKLLQFLRSNSFDIIHVHLFPALYYLALLKPFLKNRLIFTEHSSSNRRMRKAFLRPLERVVYGQYNSIIAITPAIQEILIRWIGYPKKIHLVYNGVDVKEIRKIEPIDMRKSYSLSESDTILLMTGRFEYPKRQELVLDIFSKLPKNYMLFFLGDGSNRETCEKKAVNMGLDERIWFLGNQKDPIQFMKAADVNILLTDYEGFSTVALEALACGKPLVASKVAGIVELLGDESQFLVDNSNIDEIIAQIVESTYYPELQMQQVERYSLDKMIVNHYHHYQKLLNQSNEV
ncbi:glycosyltransferase [Sphingobacterium wenxiniae]|uniref:Glycosyltransferase involved in cell wall bisynthesis n=1 Tax=Sphingobacterium wenxiniae TaxID=683125 RepID=A0A1I6U957_9SPHI|nr:glycosyltransferase [Sphingobacterium wenxiniae]SFS97807.1 Glycosyltransferase involved in cell wall bisynthesis [Sphingobacterium wenxiniae]